MHKLRIYDIDGTITHPGKDLWYLTTKHLSLDIGSFEKEVANWKEEISSGQCPYKSSYSMMAKGIQLMALNAAAEKVKNEAKEITKSILKEGKYFEGAIIHINKSLEEGYKVILSTTNYYDGGIGFMDAIKEQGLICSNGNGIYISGSKINWKDKTVIHFNMGENKVNSICELFSLNKEELIRQIDSCYGDDPDGNDKGILNLVPNTFVIKNKKNENCRLLKHMKLTDWEQILKTMTITA